MKEKKGLSRYRKQIVFLMDLFIVNFVYFVMIYWVPIRNGTLITEIFTWIPNLTLMIFCLLYSPCIAAVATIRKETGSTRWTLGMVLFQLLTAWGAAVLVFQIGSLLF